jgi:hypothetical protein
MLQVRNGSAKVNEIVTGIIGHNGTNDVERFAVQQEQDNLWSVSSNGRTLSLYPSEEAARWAALMLASERCQSGHQASVTISPAQLRNPGQAEKRLERFTGM